MRTILTAGVLVLLAAGAVEAGDVAIIVARNHPQNDVTMTQLERLFRLDQQYWKSGDRVEPVLQMGGSAKELIVLERVYHLRAEDMKPFWLGKIYRGELTAAPRILASDAGVKQYVANSLRAIGYIDAVMLDNSVKALRVDGKLPGEPGYPLAR